MSVHTKGSNYGYTPSLAWCTTYITLFGLTAVVHSVQAWRSKYWVIYPTLVLGAVLEVMGWVARLWSNKNVTLLNPFLMQQCVLVLAPVFFSAYDYVVLGSAINRLGAQYSLLPPSLYFAIFITADVISLTIQGVGGGTAAAKAAVGIPSQTDTNIMVVGIIFQMVSMAVFLALGFDFILRATSGRPYAFQERRLEREAERRSRGLKSSERKWWGGRRGDQEVEQVEKRAPAESPVGLDHSETSLHGGASPQEESTKEQGALAETVEHRENLTRWWILLGAALISSIVILIRGVYRSIELTQGWTGFLITHQMYENMLDALPMLIAVAVFNVLHPGWLLPTKKSWRGYH